MGEDSNNTNKYTSQAVRTFRSSIIEITMMQLQSTTNLTVDAQLLQSIGALKVMNIMTPLLLPNGEYAGFCISKKNALKEQEHNCMISFTS